MSVCIIYHSETGNTRRVAENIASASGADLIEVKDLAGYTKVGMYTNGIRMARQGLRAKISPDRIDLSDYDSLVIGTPVWAFRPTPAINAAVAALEGCEGKSAVAFATSRGMPANALEMLSELLTDRGIHVEGTLELSEKEIKDPVKIGKLVSLIQRL